MVYNYFFLKLIYLKVTFQFSLQEDHLGNTKLDNAEILIR